MATVYVKQRADETKQAALERAIKKFKKECEKDKIMKEILDRRFFISKTEKRKQMEKAGRRKQLKKMYKEKALDKYYD